MLHRPAFVAFALHNAEPASPLPTLPSCRPYTPTSEIHQRGHVDFVIKLYDDGQMSQVLVRPRFDPPPPARSPRRFAGLNFSVVHLMEFE